LEEIHDTIALNSPRTAARLIEAIEKQFQMLATFPETGPANHELAVGLRSFAAGS
jgi:plasmid stabilization system protein ParE